MTPDRPMKINATIRVRRDDGTLTGETIIRPRSHFSLRIERDGDGFTLLPEKPTEKGDL